MKVNPEFHTKNISDSIINSLKGGNQGATKGATEGATSILQHENHSNSIYNNKLAGQKVWITVAEGATVLGVTKRSMQRYCKNKKCETKWHTGNGGKQNKILLSSLPIEAQLKYWNERGIDFQEILNNQIPSEQIEQSDIIREAYELAPEYNRVKFDKYSSILNESGSLKGDELKQFIENWNQENPDNKTSYRSILSARKKVKELGLIGLLGSYGKNNGISSIDDFHFEYFKKIFLDEERQTAEACWVATLGYAREIDSNLQSEEFPSVSSFVRRLEAEVPKDVIDLKRKGFAYWNKHWNNYVDRDYSGIQPGEVWVSDHRQIDQAVINELPTKNYKQPLDEWFKNNQHAFQTDGRKKRPVFPWLTVWRDFLTGKWLGWFIHIEEPNTDHVLHAFKLAASKYGVPRTIIIDNGKDYRSKDFAGGRIRNYKLKVNEIKTRSLCGMLNIEAIFTIPYNAQAKPVERDFKDYKEWMDKKFPGYRGGNVLERPEKLVKEIKAGKIIKFGDYIPLMNFFVENILHKYKSNGKVLNGRSRDEAWNEELSNLVESGKQLVLRKVSEDDLKLFCMRMSKDQPIRRNGICLSQKHNLNYHHPWMDGMKGEYVYMRRDNKQYQVAWVFRSSNDEFLGKAYLNTHSAPALAKNDLEREQVEGAIRKKRYSEKIAKMLGESDLQISAEDELRHHALGIKTLNGDEDDIKVPTPKEAQIFVKTKLSEAVLKEKMMRTGTDDIDYENMQPLTKKEDDVEDWC